MGKRAYLLKLIQDIRASYWFLPSILACVGLLLAIFMGWVDHHAEDFPAILPKSFVDTQADGARSTLAVIAQSIIGVTGVMFSMTLVAVSFASGNFGPRLIGNFMRDKGNQWSLGILIATFVYALVVLRTVQDAADGNVMQYVPQYSLLVALFLTLICVFTLIYFIHHVPETINVTRISAGIGSLLEQQIRELIDGNDDDAVPMRIPERAPDHTIRSTFSGYIQTVRLDRLSSLATENDWTIRMVPEIGAFVKPTSPVFEVWSLQGLDESDRYNIEGCFAVGISRTENQNPTFLAEQLVEMAARALSPGVNDPYTAIDCLNRLTSALTVASTYKDGLKDPGLAHVSMPYLSFARLFASSFPLCSQYIKPDALATRHALSLLKDLLETTHADDLHLIRTEIEVLSSSR